MVTTESAPTTPFDDKPRRRTRTVAVVAAVAATAALWLIGEPLLGYDFIVRSPGQPAIDLGLGEIVFVTLIPSLAAWTLLAALERFTERARTIWSIIAIAVLLASFMPFTQVEVSTGSAVFLALMHIAVGAVLIPVLGISSTKRPAQKR